MKSLILVVFYIFSFKAYSTHDTVQYHLEQATRKLGFAIGACIVSGIDGDCIGDNFQDKERVLKILKDSLDYIYPEAKTPLPPPNVNFVIPKFEVISAQQRPDLFFIDGGHKIASTYPKRGSVIYINKDLITEEDFFGSRSVIDNTELSQIIFHEIGHHIGEKNHLLLDNIANELVRYLPTTRIHHIENVNNQMIYINALHEILPSYISIIHLIIDQEIIDLSKHMTIGNYKSAFCSSYSQKKFHQWFVNNTRITKIEEKPLYKTITLTTEADIQCEDNLWVNLINRHSAFIYTKINLRKDLSNNLSFDSVETWAVEDE